MNIEEALKFTGKARIGENNKHAPWQAGYNWHVEIVGKYLRWVDDQGVEKCEVSYFDHMSKEWQSYHDKKEIRPQMAGELWKNNGIIYMTVKENSATNPNTKIYLCWCCDGRLIDVNNFIPDVIHGKNKWTLLYSPDPERMADISGVQREEFDGVTWFCNTIGHIVPQSNRGQNIIFSKYTDMPPCKLIIEIPKD